MGSVRERIRALNSGGGVTASGGVTGSDPTSPGSARPQPIAPKTPVLRSVQGLASALYGSLDAVSTGTGRHEPTLMRDSEARAARAARPLSSSFSTSSVGGSRHEAAAVMAEKTADGSCNQSAPATPAASEMLPIASYVPQQPSAPQPYQGRPRSLSSRQIQEARKQHQLQLEAQLMQTQQAMDSSDGAIGVGKELPSVRIQPAQSTVHNPFEMADRASLPGSARSVQSQGSAHGSLSARMSRGVAPKGLHGTAVRRSLSGSSIPNVRRLAGEIAEERPELTRMFTRRSDGPTGLHDRVEQAKKSSLPRTTSPRSLERGRSNSVVAEATKAATRTLRMHQAGAAARRAASEATTPRSADRTPPLTPPAPGSSPRQHDAKSFFATAQGQLQQTISSSTGDLTALLPPASTASGTPRHSLDGTEGRGRLSSIGRSASDKPHMRLRHNSPMRAHRSGNLAVSTVDLGEIHPAASQPSLLQRESSTEGQGHAQHSTQSSARLHFSSSSGDIAGAAGGSGFKLSADGGYAGVSANSASSSAASGGSRGDDAPADATASHSNSALPGIAHIESISSVAAMGSVHSPPSAANDTQPMGAEGSATISTDAAEFASGELSISTGGSCSVDVDALPSGDSGSVDGVGSGGNGVGGGEGQSLNLTDSSDSVQTRGDARTLTSQARTRLKYRRQNSQQRKQADAAAAAALVNPTRPVESSSRRDSAIDKMAMLEAAAAAAAKEVGRAPSVKRRSKGTLLESVPDQDEAVFTGDEAAPSPFKSASDAASADAAAPTGPGEDEGCGTVVPPTISRRSAGGTGRGVSSRRRSSRGGRHVAFADRLSTSSGAAIPPPGVETTATVSMSSDPGATLEERMMGKLMAVVERLQHELFRADGARLTAERKTKAAREEAETVVGGLREATADRQFLAAEARRVQAALDAALLARSAKQDALRERSEELAAAEAELKAKDDLLGDRRRELHQLRVSARAAAPPARALAPDSSAIWSADDSDSDMLFGPGPTSPTSARPRDGSRRQSIPLSQVVAAARVAAIRGCTATIGDGPTGSVGAPSARTHAADNTSQSSGGATTMHGAASDGSSRSRSERPWQPETISVTKAAERQSEGPSAASRLATSRGLLGGGAISSDGGTERHGNATVAAAGQAVRGAASWMMGAWRAGGKAAPSQADGSGAAPASRTAAGTDSTARDKPGRRPSGAGGFMNRPPPQQSLERSNSGLGGVPRLRTGSGHLASTNLVSGGSSSPHGGSLEAALASLSGSGSVHDGTNGRNSRRASVRTGGPGNDGGLGAALSGLSPGPRPSGFAGTVVD